MTTQLDDWKKALQAELKLADVSHKLSKKTIEGIFDILSVESVGQVIPNSTPWKKSSQTYFKADASIEASIQDDLAHGVRGFFFYPAGFEAAVLAKALKIIESHDDAKDIEVVLLGEGSDAINTVSALQIAEQAGTHLQELAKLTLNLVQWAQTNADATQVSVMITTDNHYFQSIAKIRALREIAERIFLELDRKVTLKVISIVNQREWTLFERYNNMLRNSAAVSGALVGGADVIQTLGYMAPFEVETDVVDAEHLERSRRMARNTTHILSLESMLGMVQDAAAGSYHLERMTDYFCEESWRVMRTLISQPAEEQAAYFEKEVTATRNERVKQFNRRQLVLSGINDYPNVKETLNLKAPLKFTSYRTARDFELLRLRVEKLKPAQKKKVRIVFWGDYATLNARLNFTKNYFELLGLEVLDPLHSTLDDETLNQWLSQGSDREIQVLCAKDEDYIALAAKVKPSAIANFVAGKVDVEGYTAIFGGQDLYPILLALVNQLEVSK